MIKIKGTPKGVKHELETWILIYGSSTVQEFQELMSDVFVK